MKQNHKKIKIYSEALCNSVDTFETFQNVKACLHELTALSKKDLMINTFLKSKSVDLNKKMNGLSHLARILKSGPRGLGLQMGAFE